MSVNSSIELQVICKILLSDDEYEVNKLCSYDDSYYSVLNEQIDFILDHREKTGKVPDTFTFQAQFEDFEFIEVNEPLDYLETKLKENKQRILLLQTVNKLADLGADDTEVAWEYLTEQCDKAINLSAEKPTDIVADAEDRAQKLLEYNNQTRIPTGFKEIDELMYGGLSTVEEFLLIVARTNSGKAQPLWSKILTPSGWVKMGSIKVGDTVIGENNDFGHVVKIFPQGNMGYYRITFDDNSEVDCCDNHLWNVLSEDRRNSDNPHYNEVETLEFKYIREHLNNNYSIDLSYPVSFYDSGFNRYDELDPYLLGMILGDGDLLDDCVRTTNESNQIWGRIEPIIKSYNCNQFGKHTDIDSGVVRNKLIDYGIMVNRSIDKFIPKQFLTAPVDVRFDLLAGLLDTGGYIPISNEGNWEFDTASEKLADDFVELARSLGCFVKLYQRNDSSHIADDVKNNTHGILHIVVRSKFNPFCHNNTYDRYSDVISATEHRRLCKKIKSVKYMGTTECQCILLDNKSHTYITDGYTVTHNTWVTVKLMESAQKAGFPVLYYSPEMQSTYIGARFDTWRDHFKNSDIFRGRYTDEYKRYLKELPKEETPALVVEDKDMSDGKTTVRGLETLVKRYHAKLLVIDGLSYIASTTKYSNESIRYRDICNDLFRLSKKYGCAVVATVQANRESRENRDENGDVFPDIYHISESDHPARIATQVFALRQLYERHMIQFRLEKSRNAINERPVLSYRIDFNQGIAEYAPEGEDASMPEFSTPNVSNAVITNHVSNDDVIDLPDSSTNSDISDDDDEDIEF